MRGAFTVLPVRLGVLDLELRLLPGRREADLELLRELVGEIERPHRRFFKCLFLSAPK